MLILDHSTRTTILSATPVSKTDGSQWMIRSLLFLWLLLSKHLDYPVSYVNSFGAGVVCSSLKQNWTTKPVYKSSKKVSHLFWRLRIDKSASSHRGERLIGILAKNRSERIITWNKALLSCVMVSCSQIEYKNIIQNGAKRWIIEILTLDQSAKIREKRCDCGEPHSLTYLVYLPIRTDSHLMPLFL